MDRSARETQTQIDTAVAALGRGGIIAYPTETVYGLGCDPFSNAAMTRLSDLKGGRENRSFLVLVRDASQIEALVGKPSPLAKRLMDTFWPGPLTLVLPAAPTCPSALVSEQGRVGLRHSPDPVVEKLMDAWGRPLVSTSANPGGASPANTADQVRAYFGEILDCVLDGGERRALAPSTVLSVHNEELKLLRPGALDAQAIEAATGVSVHG